MRTGLQWLVVHPSRSCYPCLPQEKTGPHPVSQGMRTLLLAMAATLLLVVPALGASHDETDIATAIAEHEGHTATAVRVCGDWALADVMGTDDGGARKLAVAVLHRRDGHWEVTAELAGAGAPTEEALVYHEVDEAAAARLIDRATRDEQKPIVKLLRKSKPEVYPHGVMFENIVVADNWAVCAYRSRASIRKSDTLHQALLRRTAGAWHLVEDAGEALDLVPYGVPANIRKALQGRR